MAQLSSSKAKFAAFAMAGIAATTSFSSAGFAQSAQQVSMPTQCASINTATAEGKARQLDCTLQQRYNAANAQTAENIAEGDCAKRLVTVAADPAQRTRGQQILAGRSIGQYGACNLLRALSNS